jgi:penicillin-insensitive murein endopeptidase
VRAEVFVFSDPQCHIRQVHRLAEARGPRPEALLPLVLILLVGCAELGVAGDNGSISFGKPSGGKLIDGARIPDHGPGFTTADVWRTRGNRYGTDELVELITGVALRMSMHVHDAQLVVADMSGRHGGDGGAAFHRSHQSGRDCDLVYYTRDARGKAVTPDSMRVFDGEGVAKDGSGVTIDFTRQWQLVREILTAPEANVQWLFMYEPIAEKVLAKGKELGASDELLARARATLRQPGDSARHDDHMHVRVYCSAGDRELGCVDIGPMERLDRGGLVVRAELPPDLSARLPSVATRLR